MYYYTSTREISTDMKILIMPHAEGFKWAIGHGNETILESVRVHLSKEDADIHAKHWLSKLGLVIAEKKQ
jgi:hypothetical protein